MIYRSISKIQEAELAANLAISAPGTKRDVNSHCSTGSHLSAWISFTDYPILLFTQKSVGTDVRETGSSVILTIEENGLELRNKDIQKTLGLTKDNRARRNALSSREYLVDGGLTDYRVFAKKNEFKELWEEVCDSFSSEDVVEFHQRFYGSRLDGSKRGAENVLKDAVVYINRWLCQKSFFEALKGLYYIEKYVCIYDTMRKPLNWWRYVTY